MDADEGSFCILLGRSLPASSLEIKNKKNSKIDFLTIKWRSINSKLHVIVFASPSPEKVAHSICGDEMFRLEHSYSTEISSIRFVIEFVDERRKMNGIRFALVDVTIVFRKHVDVVENHAIVVMFF